jgi:hypothetical protein
VKWVYVAGGAYLANCLWNTIDLYSQVRTYYFWKTLSYHAFTLAKTLLSLFAFYLLSNVQFKLDENNSIDFSNQIPIVFFLSLFATFSIIESFSLKLGSFRIIDLGKVIEDFKARVAEDAQSKRVQAGREKVQMVAERLSKRLAENELRIELFVVMDLTQDEAREAELEAIKKQAEKMALPVERLLAQRIANVDIVHAERLLRESSVKMG